MFEFTAVDGAAVCSAKEKELKLAMEKANAIFFAIEGAVADAREVIDFVATELRDKRLQGELELHLKGEPGVVPASIMWVDGSTREDEWLACFMIPKHWRLKLPDDRKDQLGNVKVVYFGGFDIWVCGSIMTWCEVDLNKPTQRELDRRELYEALHLE